MRHIFLVVVLGFIHNHTPLKHRCPVKIKFQIRLIHLTRRGSGKVNVCRFGAKCFTRSTRLTNLRKIGSFHIQVYLSSIQHKILTPYRFVADSFQMTWTRQSWGFQANLHQKSTWRALCFECSCNANNYKSRGKFSAIEKAWEAFQDGLFVCGKRATLITLSSKPRITFSKEHQTDVCRFDALSRAKVALLLNFT